MESSEDGEQSKGLRSYIGQYFKLFKIWIYKIYTVDNESADNEPV